MSESEQAAAVVRERLGDVRPRLGIVLGSGLDAVAEQVTWAESIEYGDLPGFPLPTVAGHSGSLLVGRLGNTEVALLRGRSHVYESGRSDGMRGPLETLKALGCGTLILTNAAGSVMPYAVPGSLVLITDHIALGLPNPLVGEHSPERFLDMSQAYDPALIKSLSDLARGLAIHVHQGVYMWFSGPSFETPAEIRAANHLGADLVGMSTVPETVLARFLGLRVAGISVVTNFAAGMEGQLLSHEQTMRAAGAAAQDLARLLSSFAEGLGGE